MRQHTEKTFRQRLNKLEAEIAHLRIDNERLKKENDEIGKLGMSVIVSFLDGSFSVDEARNHLKELGVIIPNRATSPEIGTNEDINK